MRGVLQHTKTPQLYPTMAFCLCKDPGFSLETSKVESIIFSSQRMKKLMLLPLLLLVACSPKPTSVVERYLKAVQAGNLAEQNKLLCVSGAADKSLIKSAPSWTIVGEESRTIDSFHYQVVTVKIEDRTFGIKVWKSNDIYKQHTDITDNLKQHGVEFDPAPNRSQWSSEESCVSVGEK